MAIPYPYVARCRREGRAIKLGMALPAPGAERFEMVAVGNALIVPFGQPKLMLSIGYEVVPDGRVKVSSATTKSSA